MNHVFWYVKSRINYGIMYDRVQRTKELVDILDNDLRGDVMDNQSTSGAVFYLGESVIIWEPLYVYLV